MLFNRLRVVFFAVLTTVVSTSCGGGGSNSPTPPSATQAAPSNLTKHTYALTAASGLSAAVTVRSSAALPDSAIKFQSDRATSPCPSVPAIQVVNPFSFPVTIDIDSFTVRLFCTANGLFGATFYQISPKPALVSPVKLGDAQVNGSTLTFTSTVENITLQPLSISQITILPEKSTAEVAFPAFTTGSTTNLTANSPNLPTGLNFTYQSSSGGSTYTIACFNAFTNNVLNPELAGPPPVPLVGVPSFFCDITPVNKTTINFGEVNTFDIVNPKPDRAVFEPDGTAQGFECTLENQCKTPQFSVPTTYQRFIVGNVQDLHACVPATPNVDCNGVPNDPQGGTASTVSSLSDFQFLVASDPTYKPGTAAAPVPWTGLFTVTTTGPCVVSAASDNNNGDVPPNYSDSEQNGVGPYAEFDIHPTGAGSCVLTATEDKHYITDFSDPQNPKPRSFTVTVTTATPE